MVTTGNPETGWRFRFLSGRSKELKVHAGITTFHPTQSAHSAAFEMVSCLEKGVSRKALQPVITVEETESTKGTTYYICATITELKENFRSSKNIQHFPLRYAWHPGVSGILQWLIEALGHGFTLKDGLWKIEPLDVSIIINHYYCEVESFSSLQTVSHSQLSHCSLPCDKSIKHVACAISLSSSITFLI